MHKPHSERRLRSVLIRAIRTWSGALFVVLSFAFTLSDERLANDLLARDAQSWLGNQIGTIGKLLATGDIADLDTDMPTLISGKDIAGLAVLDANGKVLYSAFKPRWTPGADMAMPMQLSPHLIIFKHGIPGTHDRLWLIMDRQSAMATIQAAAASTAGLMLLLLALIVLGVHVALRRRTATPPPGHLPQAIHPTVPMAQVDVQDRPHEPVGEDTAIQPVQDNVSLGERFHEILDLMPSCLWWADGTLRYRQVSERASELFGMEPQQLAKKPLLTWLNDQDQSLANR